MAEGGGNQFNSVWFRLYSTRHNNSWKNSFQEWNDYLKKRAFCIFCFSCLILKSVWGSKISKCDNKKEIRKGANFLYLWVRIHNRTPLSSWWDQHIDIVHLFSFLCMYSGFMIFFLLLSTFSNFHFFLPSSLHFLCSPFFFPTLSAYIRPFALYWTKVSHSPILRYCHW